MLHPDTTKTEQVEPLLANGDGVAEVSVALNPSRHAGETWLVVANFGRTQTTVALCDFAHHAAAVAYALAGSLDCDLRLSDDLEARLTQNHRPEGEPMLDLCVRCDDSSAEVDDDDLCRACAAEAEAERLRDALLDMKAAVAYPTTIAGAKRAWHIARRTLADDRRLMRLTTTDQANVPVRIAQEEHPCVACHRTISPGEHYAENHAENLMFARGAHASGWRYCAACAVKHLREIAPSTPIKDSVETAQDGETR